MRHFLTAIIVLFLMVTLRTYSGVSDDKMDLHLPPLFKVALMHYQFETIHPFLDGNGRIGRLMVPLYLISSGILKKPVLYLSDYLERNRQEYYDRLTRAREEDALNDWLIFFLDGLSETAHNGVDTFNDILKFKADWEATLQGWNRQSAPALALFRHLFNHPCLDAQNVAGAAGVSLPTAYKIIDRFVEHELLQEITGAKRGRLFLFLPYIRIFKGKTRMTPQRGLTVYRVS